MKCIKISKEKLIVFLCKLLGERFKFEARPRKANHLVYDPGENLRRFPGYYLDRFHPKISSAVCLESML